MDEIDRIMSDDEIIRPSTGFSTRVMRAVREEAERPAPLEFPWSRFLPGLCTCLALTLAGLVLAGWFTEPGTAAATQLMEPPAWLPTAEWLDDPVFRGLLWAVAALGASGLLAWAALRFGAPRSSPGF